MTDWITWDDLKNRWNKQGFELLEFFIKGLQPYTKNGYPMNCPTENHKHRKLQDEHSKVHKKIESMEKPFVELDHAILPDTAKTVKPNKNLENKEKEIEQLKKEKQAIRDKMASIEGDGSGLADWKYLIIPENDWEMEALIAYLENPLFKVKELSEFEKEHNIPIYESNISKQKGQRVSSHHKALFCEAADKIWKIEPRITSVRLAKHLRKEVVVRKKNGKLYTEGHIRKWISKFNPDKKQGRKPKEWSDVPIPDIL